MRFLQVGLGSMGKRRIRCIQALRAGDVIGVDPRADRRAEAERLYGVRTLADFEEGMGAEPDAVIISTPPNQHVDYALSAIEARKAFFVEETVMLEPDAVMPVLEALDEKPVLAAASCTMRFHPAISQIRRVLEDGEIGRALSFAALCVSYLPDWHPWERVQDFYVGSRVGGGGREMVIFELDWLEWLFGHVTSVVADVIRLSTIPADIDDTFNVLCQFSGGVHGCLTSSVAYRVPARTLEICGENGQVSWDNRVHRTMVYTAGDGKWRQYMETASREYSFERMYVDELNHFLQAMRGEVDYMRDFRDVRRMLGVLKAVERSAAEGRRIELAS